MGESSLPLAEASVGKNAERVSHELGAREPSISTAPACVGGRSGDSPRTFLQSDDSQVLTSDVTQTDRWDPTVRHLLFLLQWRRVFFYSTLTKKGIYFFTFDLVYTIMPADTMEKQTASPIAGAPANGTHTPDKPKNASEHRKVRILMCTCKQFSLTT